MNFENLTLERPQAGVAVVALNRVEARNALTTAMQYQLDQLLKELESDERVRVVVLTGRGERAFSSGYDIKELGGFDEAQVLENYKARAPLIGDIANYPKPLIGAINGVAHGAGAIIASLLDIRVGGPRSEFRFTAVAYGGVNNTWQLPRIVGHSKALEYTMTARAIGAEEALRAGLLDHLVTDDHVLAKAIEIAAQIAVHPPAAVQQHKTLIQANAGRSLAEAYEAENAVMRGALRPSPPAELFKNFLAEHSNKN